MADRQFTWDDDARVIVWPPDHPASALRGSLADCIRHAIEVDDGDPKPATVEIAHGSDGLIQMEEVRRMRADASFPNEEITIEDMELGPMG